MATIIENADKAISDFNLIKTAIAEKGVDVADTDGRDISAWVRKAWEESRKDYNDFVLMLIPARTDTKWWWDWVKDKATLFWIKGRVKFGEHSVGAPFPSVLALYMKDIKG